MRVVRCYWTNCCGDVVIKWHPSKNPVNFLFVCQCHFNVLEALRDHELIKDEHYSIIVE